MTTETTTTTQDWTEIISGYSAAKAAARSRRVFSRAGQWFIIEAGCAFEADAEQAEVIEAEFAAAAAMLVEFGAIDEAAEFTAEAFEADAEAQAQAFSAEAASEWGRACRQGFASF